ncbi:unnamed protein product [Effrenium voratum]|nr:unnamed protein product [Effrenium voratum]
MEAIRWRLEVLGLMLAPLLLDLVLTCKPWSLEVGHLRGRRGWGWILFIWGRSPVRLRMPESMVLRNTQEKGGRRVLFLMGLPGAGKTTVKRQRLFADDVDIEPDSIKRRHHRFSEDMGEDGRTKRSIAGA